MKVGVARKIITPKIGARLYGYRTDVYSKSINDDLTAAYVIGNDDPIAEINDTCSFTSDTPDFWRREGEDYPRHGGRFSGEPGYFKHVESAAKMMMERRGTRPSDYDYAVFHQPNAKFPQKAAKSLGFTAWITVQPHNRSHNQQTINYQMQKTFHISLLYLAQNIIQQNTRFNFLDNR